MQGQGVRAVNAVESQNRRECPRPYQVNVDDLPSYSQIKPILKQRTDELPPIYEDCVIDLKQ